MGDSPGAPLEKCLSDVRVWGSAEGGEEKGEGKREDVSEASWSAGTGQGLAAALQGCREGSGGGIGVLGEGHWAVRWWVWGCFTLRIHGRPWHPSCTALGACKENNPPWQGGSTPYAVLSAYR